MLNLQQRLLAHLPDFCESRNGAHLLVWGGLGQWLVVDDDLKAFLDLLDGRRTVGAVASEHAQRTGRARAQVEREASKVAEELWRRSILHNGSLESSNPSGPLQLANVTVNLTNRCNLRCAWCYNAGRTTDEMRIDAIMDGIEQGRRILAPDASFIILGGEPFVDVPRLLRAVERAERLFTTPTLVSTNGTLLASEVVAALAGRRIEVQVSIDGPDRAVHDAVRGPGAFDRAVEGTRCLVKADVYTILSMVYDGDGISRFEAYLDLARQLGAQEARFIPMRVLGRGAEHHDRIPDQLTAFRQLTAVLEARPELRRLLGRDFFSILVETCRRASHRAGCGIGEKVVFVDADGTVYPCPNHVRAECRCGSLADGDLASLIERSPVFAEMGRRYRIERYERCAACAFRRWCAGDCRGETLAVTGNPQAPAVHCEELRALIPEVMWLVALGRGPFAQGAARAGTRFQV